MDQIFHPSEYLVFGREHDTWVVQLDLASGHAIQHLAHDFGALTHLRHADQIALIAITASSHRHFKIELVIEEIGFRSSEIQANAGGT
jgi:hypothetical protein